MDRDARRLHRGGDMAARLVVKAAQDLRAAVQLADLDAQPVQDAGEFAGDIAPADHQGARGQRGQVEHGVRGHGKIGPRDIGNEGPPAGRHQDVPRGDFLPRGQAHPVRVGKRSAAVVDRDAGIAQRGAIGGFQPVKLGLQRGAELRPVKALRPDGPAVTVGQRQGRGKARGKDHQLFRHAAPDDAGTAHAAFLGQGDAGPMLARGDARRAHPARAAADDEKIIVEGHGPRAPFACPGTRHLSATPTERKPPWPWSA